MIKLGYIEGYNSYTEFKFNDANDRDSHFNDWVERTIDAYYPPYYTNVIKVDISEVPQTLPINFVILVHNSKYYYYFVDHFNYINEDIYEIVINMDTVLTYMFDFRVRQGLITRKSINRWNGNDINRNYVRENVSEGIMEVSSFAYRSPNKYLIVTSDERYVTGAIAPPNIIEGFNRYDVGYYVYVIPLLPNDYDLTDIANIRIYNQNFVLIKTVNIADYVNLFIDNPHTINMMIVESDYLDKTLGTLWGVEVVLDVPYLSLTIMNQLFDSTRILHIDNSFYAGFMFGVYDLSPQRVTTITSEFVKNTTPFTLFDYRYVPQLFDENYMQIEYGDITGFSSYPLHQSTSTVLNLYNSTDITNGNNAYYILDNNTTNNKYNTNIISLGLTFDLITDPWKQYQAQNKGTLSTGMQLQAVNSLYSTAKGMLLPTATKLFNDTRALQYFEQGKQGLSDVYANQSYRNHQQQLTGGTDGLMQGINIIANYQINKENLEYSPDTVKGRGDVHSMIMTKYKKPYIKIHKVNDLVNCARKLEEYGYRVNEVFNGNEYISTICTIRTLYNCISMRITEYSTNCFIPNDIINDILFRVENGLRFIDVHSVPDDIPLIDVFRYDNVER